MTHIPAALIGLAAAYALLALLGRRRGRVDRPAVRPNTLTATDHGGTKPTEANLVQLTDAEMGRVVAELTYLYARIGSAKHLPGADLYKRDSEVAAILDRATEEDRASAYVQAGAQLLDIAVTIVSAATGATDDRIARDLVSAAAFDRETYHMAS